VLDAQRSLYAAEDQLIRSDRTVGVTLIAIYKALGGGWALDDSLRPENPSVRAPVTSPLPPAWATARSGR
jgi:hypothetical protein